MGRLLDLISARFIQLLEGIMVLMMLGMLILVGVNVFLRIGANSGIDYAEEIPRFMFIWLTFCGAVVAMKQNTHINVSMFVHMVGRPVQQLFYGITQVLVLVCGAYITYGTFMLHDIIYQNASPVLQISTLWVYGVTYIAGPALTLIAVANLIRLALGRVTDQELAEKHEDDPEELAARELEKVGRELAAAEEALREKAVPAPTPEKTMTLIIYVATLLFFVAIGTPISFALLGCALALMVHLGMTDPQIVVQNMWDGANSFPLLAVPFFMLAGEFMNAGGMTKRIIKLAMAWVGHIKGGLGYVAVIAAVIMASLSGSAVADTAALAAILLPMMKSAGYNLPRSGGLIAAGGVIAPVIPPSIGMILLGVSGQVSIAKLFLAGIVPGILMGVAIMATWYIVARKDDVVVEPRVPMKKRLTETRNAFWALLLPVIIIGGLKTGFFTPTEAAVIAAWYSLAVGLFVYREIGFKDLYKLFLAASKTTAIVLFLVAAASVSAWLVTAVNIPQQLGEVLQPFMDNKMLLMVVLMLLGLVMGCVLDFTPNILIMTPVLIPIVKAAGIDPVYFGVLYILNQCLGLLTPPVGAVLNVISTVGKMPMNKVVWGVWPFLLAETGVMALLVVFPDIVLLPLKWMTR